jgi:hypothetical protein
VLETSAVGSTDGLRAIHAGSGGNDDPSVHTLYAHLGVRKCLTGFELVSRRAQRSKACSTVGNPPFQPAIHPMGPHLGHAAALSRGSGGGHGSLSEPGGWG